MLCRAAAQLGIERHRARILRRLQLSRFCIYWSVMETPRNAVLPFMVTTALELPGYRIVRSLGVVRGVTVRSRSVFGTIGGALQTLVGGNISLFTELCEKTRQEAFDIMLVHAAQHGANAVVSMRYDANEVMDGVTEVLAYGTAVVVEEIRQ